MKSDSTDTSALAAWLGEETPSGVLAGLLSGPKITQAPARPPRGERLRVLMLLCQKTGSTGSGVVVKEMVDGAGDAGVEFAVLCGGYDGDTPERLFARQPARLEVMRFLSGDGLPFPIAGMSNEMPYPSVPFHSLGAREIEAYVEAWHSRVRRMIAEFRPHVIHAHHLWLLACVAKLAAPELPVVATVHGTDFFRAGDAPHLRELVAPWVGAFEALLTLTPCMSERVAGLYGPVAKRIEVFGNGFNARHFAPRAPDVSVLSRLGIVDDGRAVILCVAKFDPRKGIEWLIRAYAGLPAEIRRSARLVITGDGPERERARLRAVAGAEDIHFTGAVAYEHVGELMNLASLFVLPAYREPFGLVVLEALACGCPVIATEQAGPPAFIPATLRESGDAVLLAGLSSPHPQEAESTAFTASLRDAMLAMLRRPSDAGRRDRISTAVRGMTWGGYMARLAELYHSVLDETPGLAGFYTKLAGIASAAPVNRVKAGLPIRLSESGGIEFSPASSLAIQSLVPRDSVLHTAFEAIREEITSAFPDAMARAFWQPSGTYHLNVVILQRLNGDPSGQTEHNVIVEKASPALDWLSSQAGYDVDFRGITLADDGTLFACGWPCDGHPTNIRREFANREFRDQQPMFHITLARLLRELPPETWCALREFIASRFAAMPLGVFQAREALLVSESKACLHSASAYRVLRTFRWAAPRDTSPAFPPRRRPA